MYLILWNSYQHIKFEEFFLPFSSLFYAFRVTSENVTSTELQVYMLLCTGVERSLGKVQNTVMSPLGPKRDTMTEERRSFIRRIKYD